MDFVPQHVLSHQTGPCEWYQQLDAEMQAVKYCNARLHASPIYVKQYTFALYTIEAPDSATAGPYHITRCVWWCNVRRHGIHHSILASHAYAEGTPAYLTPTYVTTQGRGLYKASYTKVLRVQSAVTLICSCMPGAATPHRSGKQSLCAMRLLNELLVPGLISELQILLTPNIAGLPGQMELQNDAFKR